MVATLTPLQFGVPGGMELAVILLIAILLFGANKIPKLARSTGQAMGEFRRGREEIDQEIEELKGEAMGEPTGSSAASGGAAETTSATEQSASAAEEPSSEADEDTEESK